MLVDDIILLIVDQIDTIQDLLRLLLVCRHWYDLIFPKAYECISLDGNQIYGLLCSIQSNPKIGPAIRDLSIGWPSYQSYEPGYFDHNVAIFKDFLQQASPSIEYCSIWEQDLLKGHSDAWLAVLAPLLEGVEWLEVDHGWKYHFLPLLARAGAREKPFDSKPIFQSLKSVIIKDEDLKASFSANNLLPLLYFPEMQAFSVNSLHEEEDPDEFYYSNPELGTSGVSELDFDQCNGIHGMAHYVKACANLKVFNYQHQNQAVWGAEYYDFRPLKFYKALCIQKQNLQEIRLNNNGEIDGNGDNDDGIDYSGFGSLADFHQLHELRMPLRTLLQFGLSDRPSVSLPDVLPSSLEYLQLAGYYEEDFNVAIENLRSMLAQRKKRFPNLKRIEVQPVYMEQTPDTKIPHWMHYEIPESVKQAFAPFKVACDEQGIKFALTKEGEHRIRVN
ncbi:hypothetical protein N7495_005404 [Penicillium taxi]|uniref:uncharacterized protein n=1 Tax=Penicillium taxi TaxID=168475 RepID=UPI0025459914|nr:uncharacterized protein N7495_005404 [Penicillium taxi]KAJ5893713.1 hypothetical protein N7495_005404 [Penicillium taxi]